MRQVPRQVSAKTLTGAKQWNFRMLFLLRTHHITQIFKTLLIVNLAQFTLVGRKMRPPKASQIRRHNSSTSSGQKSCKMIECLPVHQKPVNEKQYAVRFFSGVNPLVAMNKRVAKVECLLDTLYCQLKSHFLSCSQKDFHAYATSHSVNRNQQLEGGGVRRIPQECQWRPSKIAEK